MGNDYCTGCGYSLIGRENSHFCPACGKKIGANVFDVSTPEPQNNTLISAYISMFKKYADFKGRSRRREYWLVALANLIIAIPMYICNFAASSSGSEDLLGAFAVLSLVYSIYALVTFVPTLALTVRRLHDIGKSGWWILISFVPCGIGAIVMLVFLCKDSESGSNMYGRSPKENYIL